MHCEMEKSSVGYGASAEVYTSLDCPTMMIIINPGLRRPWGESCQRFRCIARHGYRHC